MWNARTRFTLIGLLIATIGFDGCAAVGPAVKAGTAGLSAASAYWSWQALQSDPVNVTTLSRECTFIRYVQVPCDERKQLSAETKKAIADNNRLAIEICGMERPLPLNCEAR